MIRAVKLYTSLLALGFLAAACGGQPPQASASPSPQPTPSPSAPSAPASGSLAVLVTATTSDTYTVTLVGPDAHVAATAQASGLPALTCAGVANAVLPPPISTSTSRAYFMDAQGVVHFLTKEGQTGRATTVPVGGTKRSMFAVSPDDKRIAVIVSDFGAGKASITLYVEDLAGGGHHAQIFTQTGTFGLWPIGWHGGSLVVAKVPACSTGGEFGCCGPVELHVVDAATAARKFTIGGPTCIIGGPSTPSGTPCETPNKSARVLDWAGVILRTVPIPGQGPVFLSPDGKRLAYSTDAASTTVEGIGTINMDVCGWVDDSHIIAGGDVQHQPRIGDITTGSVVPVAAQGACAGRIPGGL